MNKNMEILKESVKDEIKHCREVLSQYLKLKTYNPANSPIINHYGAQLEAYNKVLNIIEFLEK